MPFGTWLSSVLGGPTTSEGTTDKLNMMEIKELHQVLRTLPSDQVITLKSVIEVGGEAYVTDFTLSVHGLRMMCSEQMRNFVQEEK